MDTNLLIQLIEGYNDKRTQEELLAAQNLNLDRVVDLMRAHETARTESAQMNHVPLHRMNRKFQGRQRQQQQQRPQPQDKVCHRCGSNSHMGSSSQCPAKDKQCLSCKKKGHFAKVCRQKLDQTSRQQVVWMDDAINRISVVTEVPEDPITARVWIGDGAQHYVAVNMEADSGAAPTTLHQSLYTRYFGKLPLHPVPAKLRNYDGSLIKGTKGIIKAKVMFGGRVHRSTIHVVDDAVPSVLGRNFLIPLKVVIDCGSTPATVKAVKIEDPISPSPKLTSEALGTLPGYKHKIRLRGDAVPKAVRLRPIPLARRDAAIEEIKLMDKLGIWEETTTSEWAHPMVVVPKGDGGVRITTDLTALNAHVIPERYPLPSIKELFLEISGAKIFSKLDLKKGYFHIELSEESRDLTTTITPLGLRRYKRLPMGLTDSASVFQRNIHQTLAGGPW
ncbi:MAG: hypothetical protein GY696_12730 [Gammaproteobacteria bacterium]|nr:hypothetical protein [Gammaproteobacteria bacterium]